MSAFNFVYYREHGGAGRGPFNEPPFEVFKHLGPRDVLRCTSCGSLVLGNLTGTYDPADSDEMLHARWHGEQEGKIKDAGRFDPRDAPGRSPRLATEPEGER